MERRQVAAGGGLLFQPGLSSNGLHSDLSYSYYRRVSPIISALVSGFVWGECGLFSNAMRSSENGPLNRQLAIQLGVSITRGLTWIGWLCCVVSQSNTRGSAMQKGTKQSRKELQLSMRIP